MRSIFRRRRPLPLRWHFVVAAAAAGAWGLMIMATTTIANGYVIQF